MGGCRADKGRSSTRVRYLWETSTSGTYPIYVADTRTRHPYSAYLAVRRGAGMNECMNLETRLRIHIDEGCSVGTGIRMALLLGATTLALAGCGPHSPKPTPSTAPGSSATSSAHSPS